MSYAEISEAFKLPLAVTEGDSLNHTLSLIQLTVYEARAPNHSAFLVSRALKHA